MSVLLCVCVCFHVRSVIVVFVCVRPKPGLSSIVKIHSFVRSLGIIQMAILNLRKNGNFENLWLFDTRQRKMVGTATQTRINPTTTDSLLLHHGG